jgi:hypothetical protein
VRVYWGPVLIGAAAGFVCGSVVAVALIGLLPDGTPRAALLVLVSFLVELIAGFMAGRFSPDSEALNGSQSSLLLYALASGVALTNGAGVLPLIIGAMIALIIGTLGGVLAVAARHP